MRCSLEEVVAANQRYALGHTKQELLERGLREGVTIAPVNTVEDVARFRQLEERGYWLMAPLPDGRQVRVPGVFARLTETPMTVRRWAPKLGEHNEDILGGTLGLSAQEIAAASDAAAPQGE